jgi:hypothetical protein
MGGEEQTGDRPAAPGSALSSIRARRQAAADKLYIDLAVPRIDPPIFVRLRPVTQTEINRINGQHAKSKAPDVDVVINAVTLSTACLGVFGEVDGKPDGDPDTWPKFDEDLAELLGLPAGSTAVDVVRGLYLTDGDVIATGAELAKFSGYSWQDLERASEGN